MGIRVFGPAAKAFVEALGIERGDGVNRVLHGGLVKLDTVKAWEVGADHLKDGSQVEAIYEAAGLPSARQVAETAPALSAGVDTRLIVGKLVDVKVYHSLEGTVDGALMMVTNGLRSPAPGSTPYRQMSTRTGLIVAFAVECGLGVTVGEAYTLAGEAYVAAWRAARDAARATRRR